jgi:hypothetical protein
MKLKLVLTCGACPEQYDVFDPDNTRIGYLRLRHGHFSAEYLGDTHVADDEGWLGEIVYEARPKGDGIFDSEERDYYLRWAVYKLLERIKKGEPFSKEKPKAPDVEYEIEGDAEEWGGWGNYLQDKGDDDNV